jgi:hypothetical protein
LKYFILSKTFSGQLHGRSTGHEQVNILLSVYHELSFARRADRGQPHVVVLGVEGGAGHVPVGPAFPIEKSRLHQVAEFREEMWILRQLVEDLK